MAEPLTVSIFDLRSAVQRALDAAESQLGAEVPLRVDHYWHMPVGEAFDMDKEPDSFTAGQVSDDLEAVRDPHKRVREEAWHDLSHVIGVLRALEFSARL